MDSVTDDKLTRPLGSSVFLPDFNQKHMSICKRRGSGGSLVRACVHTTPGTPLCDPHLIDGQVRAGVGNDAEHVGQVAAVQGAGALPLQDLPCTVQQPLVLGPSGAGSAVSSAPGEDEAGGGSSDRMLSPTFT